MGGGDKEKGRGDVGGGGVRDMKRRAGGKGGGGAREAGGRRGGRDKEKGRGEEGGKGEEMGEVDLEKGRREWGWGEMRRAGGRGGDGKR